MLLAAQTLYPAMHIVKHLALDLRVAIVKLGMEAVVSTQKVKGA